jgi:hypothetical protein
VLTSYNKQTAAKQGSRREKEKILLRQGGFFFKRGRFKGYSGYGIILEIPGWHGSFKKRCEIRSQGGKMKPRTACFCLVSLLLGGVPVYPESNHRTIDNTGVVCFSNANSRTGSPQLQQAREQAEIEYWRAVEAKARSSRHTPDTEVYRRPRPYLQEENLSPPKAPAVKKFRGRGTEKPDPVESKRIRSRKIKVQNRKNVPDPESKGNKKCLSRRDSLSRFD